MIDLGWHRWRHGTLTTRGLLIVASCISFIVSDCDRTATNVGASAKSDTQSVSDRTETANAIRLGYQKGGIIPIARQRGELESQLVAQNGNSAKLNDSDPRPFSLEIGWLISRQTRRNYLPSRRSRRFRWIRLIRSC